MGLFRVGLDNGKENDQLHYRKHQQPFYLSVIVFEHFLNMFVFFNSDDSS